MRRERGLAAVTAILVVAVAASAATLMLAQQSAMLDQAMLIASRAQADQYVRAGLDWSRGVLLEDQLASGSYDSLDEGWAQPIAALPVERAVVSGSITDEQGKFNLNNLAASKADIEAFKRLLASQGLAPELADECSTGSMVTTTSPALRAPRMRTTYRSSAPIAPPMCR